MANSKYEYVRNYEQPDSLLPSTWIVVRIDGRGFHKFSTRQAFEKPNDRQALELMNAAAVNVFKELPDIVLAYGNSDEYSFVLDKNCALFERRASKLVTTIVSTFTAYYVHLWSNFFPSKSLGTPLPTFDGRAICYPSLGNLRDYLCWRQVDCHINNLYNTTFWTLVLKGGLDASAAEKELSGTYAADKNEILFTRFGINYNNEPEIYRKGTVIYRNYDDYDHAPQIRTSTISASDTREQSKQAAEIDRIRADSSSAMKGEAASEVPPPMLSRTAADKQRKKRKKAAIGVEHTDIIKDEFWTRRPWLLDGSW